MLGFKLTVRWTARSLSITLEPIRVGVDLHAVAGDVIYPN
jgi:hypothetical protein